METWLHPQYKCYQRFRHVELPPPANTIVNDFRQVVSLRRSALSITRPPSFEALSAILQLTLGASARSSPPTEDRRPYPSAGGLFPVEMYLLVPTALRGGETAHDLSPGRYHLCVRSGQLEILATDLTQPELAASFARPESDAPILVLTGVPRRSAGKYGARAYRYVLFEAGHIGQQVYLACAAMGIRCCAIGAFVEGVLGEQLFLRPEVESPLYALQIGL